MTNFTKRSYLYFFVSFIGTGLQNVIPQAFFDVHYPSHKEMLLSICLLLGAALSIMTTTWWGQLPSFRQLQANHFQSIIVATILILGLSLLGLFMTTMVVIFIVLFVMTKVFSQYLVNTVDEHYVSVTGTLELGKHSQHATLFQLVGIVAAPVYFSLLYAQPLVNFLALSIISLLGLYTILSNITGQANQAQDGDDSNQGSSNGDRLHATDRLFLLYTVTGSSATLVFSANIIFLLQDFYQFDAPVQKGGMLLGLVNLTAILAVVLQKAFSRLIVGRKYSSLEPTGLLRIHLTISMLSFLLIMLLYYNPSASMWLISIVSVVLGVCYGLFRLFTREYVSHVSKQYQRPRLLIMYNNMSNYSILISAVVMFLLSLLTQVVALSFLHLALWSVIALFAVSSLVIIRFFYQIK